MTMLRATLRRSPALFLPRQASSAPRQPHEVLGVPRGASQSVIRAQYVKLAKQLHPDTSVSHVDVEVDSSFADVAEAYRALSLQFADEARSSTISAQSADVFDFEDDGELLM